MDQLDIEKYKEGLDELDTEFMEQYCKSTWLNKRLVITMFKITNYLSSSLRYNWFQKQYLLYLN